MLILNTLPLYNILLEKSEFLTGQIYVPKRDSIKNGNNNKNEEFFNLFKIDIKKIQFQMFFIFKFRTVLEIF